LTPSSCDADTSFLVSLYVLNVNSGLAAAGMKRADLPILTTPFGELELINAISLRLFRKELKATEAKAAYSLVNKDIEGGLLEVKPIPNAAFERAKQIARRGTPRLGTRTLDVLPVAIAIQFGAKVFYTFDARQAKLAVAEGLSVAELVTKVRTRERSDTS
jgi:predicted nucleic acid-binding protein